MTSSPAFRFRRAGSHRGTLLAAGVLALVGPCVYWMGAAEWAGAEPLLAESPLRIVLGAAVLLLLPGLLLGELLRYRSRHILQTVAVGFLLTQAVEIASLPVVLGLKSTVSTWVGLLLAGCLAMTAALVVRLRRDDRLHFLKPFFLWPSWPRGEGVSRLTEAFNLLVPCVLAVLAYRAGEVLNDVVGEKMLHMAFVRNYFALPLSISDLGIAPNYPPPNLVNLWEFLIAAWSRSVNVDPLTVFFRARFVIPLLGLSAMYLLTRAIFVTPRRTNAVFFGVCLMSAGLFLLSGSSMAWIHASDPSRGAFAFTGTVHHADAAMEILLPAAAASALMLTRRLRWRSGLLFVAALSATFLWHPREYLQVALYIGILGVTMLVVPGLRRRTPLFRWAGTTGTLLATAAVFMVLSISLSGTKTHAYDEAGIKRRAVGFALQPESVLGLRHFHNFPMHLRLSPTMTPDQYYTWEQLQRDQLGREWQLDHWLLLTAVCLVWLCLRGDRRDRHFAVYCCLLWGLVLCWNFSMLLVLAATYSEFFMTTTRLLYLFAYLAVAAAVSGVAMDLARLVRRGGSLLRGIADTRGLAWAADCMAVAVALGAGWLYVGWTTGGPAGAGTITIAKTLSYLMLAGCAVAVLRASRAAPSSDSRWGRAAVLSQLAFFAPILAAEWRDAPLTERYAHRAAPDWFGGDNPFGLSPELIHWVRELPPQQQLLVHPGGYVPMEQLDALALYAPQYNPVFPCAVLLKDLPMRSAISAGQNPVIQPIIDPDADRSDSLTEAGPAVDHERAQRWLSERGIDYVLVRGRYYGSYLSDYLTRHEREFETVFHNPDQRELVVRCRFPVAPPSPPSRVANASQSNSSSPSGDGPARR